MRIIGLAGLKTSGKDTTYELIKEILDKQNVHRVGFADKLKIIAARAIGYEPADGDPIEIMNECKEYFVFSVEDRREPEPVLPEITFTGREYLQWMGNYAREVFNDTFWIDQVLPKPVEGLKNDLHLMEKYPDADVVVITDVRYPNEAKRVKDLGGEVWEIVRPGTESDGHVSETPLPRDLVDRTINNSGNISWLRTIVEASL